PRSSDSQSVFFCICQDLLAAMWCQKPRSRNLCDVLARSLKDEVTLGIWCGQNAHAENNLVCHLPIECSITREGVGRIDFFQGLAVLDVCSRHGALFVNALPFLTFRREPWKARFGPQR